MNAVEQALIAFSKQEISGLAAVRAMAEGTEWYVPSLFATDRLKQQFSDRVVILSVAFDPKPRRLVLFSGLEATHLAEGRPYGPMSGPFSGTDIFDALDATETDVIDVNPGSPQERTFYMENSTFSMLRFMSQTVRMERALERSTETYVPFHELKAHAGYIVPLMEPGPQVVSVELKDIPGRFAILFTSPDRFDLYSKATGDKPPTTTLSGESLFTQLERMSFAGVLINNASPRYFILPASYFPHIVAAG